MWLQIRFARVCRYYGILWGSSLFRFVETSPTMSALPVELAFEFSKFLRPGELFRIYMASPAISNKLGASIVIARQQRRARMESCDEHIRIRRKNIVVCDGGITNRGLGRTLERWPAYRSSPFGWRAVEHSRLRVESPALAAHRNLLLLRHLSARVTHIMT